MASLHLVTGYNGSAHIKSADQGVFNAGCIGLGEYVLPIGKRFEAEKRGNNSIRIYDGALVMNGRHINLDSGSYFDATISNGTTGRRRHDIIGVRYNRIELTGIESVSPIVLEGISVEDGDDITDPTIPNTTNIVNGAATHDMPLYRVVLNGTTIERIEPLFRVLAPMGEYQQGFHNLLTNGDFQCNQRGKANYNTNGATAYTVDMWRGLNVQVVKLTEGIRLTGTSASAQGYFTQFIQLGELKTTTYTISAMVDDEICSFTVTPGGSAKEKAFGKFKISALTTSTWDNDLNGYNNKLKVNICPIGTSSFVLKYVDVFEGTVAYPHVKEDTATAMMRCRRYVQAGTQLSTWMWFKLDETTSEDVYRCVLSFDPMAKKIPTLSSCKAWYYSEAGEDTAETTGITRLSTYEAENVNAIDVEIRKKAKTAIHTRCLGFKLVYVLSCEHNPTGD